jgi:phage-related protein
MILIPIIGIPALYVWYSGGLRNAAENIGNAAGWVMENIISVIAGLIQGIFEWITGSISALLRIIGRLIESLSEFVVEIAVDIADSIVGGLNAVLDMFKNTLEDIPALFEAFEKFVADVFPFMPPEFVMLLTFGIVLLAAVGIIKAILGIFM